MPDFVDAMLKAHKEELDYESRKDLGDLSEQQLELLRRKGI